MSSPLRVMQIVLSLAIGGTERLVCDIVQRVDYHTISPVVCCLDEFGYFGEELRQQGYRVYTLNRRPGIDWKLVQHLQRLIWKERIDVVHAHQYTPYFYAMMASFAAFWKPSIPTPGIIFTEHGRFYPDQKKLKRVLCDPFFSLFTDEIVSISQSTKASMVKFDNFPASKITIIYNGIDLNRFSGQIDVASKKQALNLPGHTKMLGIVARLDPIKNHAMLLRALPQVLHQCPETFLVIVGDGPERYSLESLADSLGLAENVRFLGHRDDLQEIYPLFDIFVLPSFSEGTSVTLLEAMGAGLPIVATNVGGNPEVVENGKTGYLVEDDNENEMAAMLIKLLHDPSLRQQMGKAGRQRVHAKFSLQDMVAAYTELYLKIGKNKKER